MKSVKICCNAVHPAFLLHRERATALAMTAVQAGIRIYGQFGIMICRNIVACQGKVIIFIHKTDIDAGRARLTMVAIHTGTCNGDCRQNTGTVNRILQTLIVRQCYTKGRLIGGQKLTRKKGLHDGNAHALSSQRRNSSKRSFTEPTPYSSPFSKS